MTSLTALQDFSALGLLALMVLLAYSFASRMFVLLNAHLKALQDMDTSQTILLQACFQELQSIRQEIAQVARPAEGE